MTAHGASFIPTRTRSPISLLTLCASLASILTRGLRTSSSGRRNVTNRIGMSTLPRAEARDEIRLLASRFRRLAAQRRKRKHASELGVREEAFAANEKNGFYLS